MSKETMFVSFSGGRTSAYMCWWLLNNKADEYNFIFVFANTGLEHEKTLEFVDRCDKTWGLGLMWLEARVNPKANTPIAFNVVNFEAASRYGEPFEALISKHGIPNAERPFCSQYLKTRVINSFKDFMGYPRNHLTAIGIRADEFDRMNKSQIEAGSVVYPLISMTHTTKDDVLLFFRGNDFDLDLDDRLGNCVACFKKSDRHLMTVAEIDSKFFDFHRKCEQRYSHIKDASGGRCKDGDPYRFFRGNKTADQIIEQSQQPFTPFVTEKSMLQPSLNIDPLDQTDDCGGRCEAFGGD